MEELVRVFNLKDFKSKIYQKVQKQIKYKFSSISLLSQALIHPSFNYTEKNKNYERLEFLGDRVLGLIIADFLFNNFASESEGDLSQRFSVLVSGETILKVSKHIELENIIQLVNDENIINNKILIDSLEAIIGAIYLDGGFKEAELFVLCRWKKLMLDYKSPPRDPKSLLQEWSMSNNQYLPIYRDYIKNGPDHSPVFSVKVFIEKIGEAEGTGNSKKTAESNAAENLYKNIN